MVTTPEEKEAPREETLEALQRRLIAEMLHAKPEDLTDEFLDRFLEDRVYPTTRFNIGSEYGGYDNSYLAVLSQDELAAIAEAVAVARERLRREIAQLKR